MARSETLRRLHAVPKDTPVKSVNLTNVEIDVSVPAPRERVRGRFVIGRRETAVEYSVDPGTIMSVMSAEVPTSQAARFARLREREQASRIAEAWRLRQGRRGEVADCGPVAIQT